MIPQDPDFDSNQSLPALKGISNCKDIDLRGLEIGTPDIPAVRCNRSLR
jgi:hypothetical protein